MIIHSVLGNIEIQLSDMIALFLIIFGSYCCYLRWKDKKEHGE
jgi:hypothetical protein